MARQNQPAPRHRHTLPALFALAALTLLLLSACTPATRDTDTDTNGDPTLLKVPQTVKPPVPPPALRDDVDVRRVVDGIIAADNTGDLEAVLSFYAEDAILLPPNGDPIRGIEAIRHHYEELFQNSVLYIRAISRETQVNGDWAFDRGTINGQLLPREDEDGKTTGEPKTINDKYVMTLHRDGENGWRITRLIWNSTNP
jgi:uncharacterized protein (TIGR02246 family)